MSFLRRLALKAIIAAKKPSIMAAAGPLQHGVGANKMIKSIQHFAEADQSRVMVTLDLQAACQNVSRLHTMHSLGQHDPDLATVFSRWYTRPTTHRMHHDGSDAHIQASSGVDQGCPLSPCGFAAAVAMSRFILRMLDSDAKRTCAPHRHPPITLHDLQKPVRCRPTTLRTRQMPGRPHDHTPAPRCASNNPSQGFHDLPNLVLRRKEHAWMLFLTYEAAGTTLILRLLRRSPPMLDSYPPAVAAQATWLPRTKVHQIPIQRHGPPTNSHPRRLGIDSDHPAQQCLQTTAPSRHHVTPGSYSSPPPHASLHATTPSRPLDTFLFRLRAAAHTTQSAAPMTLSRTSEHMSGHPRT